MQHNSIYKMYILVFYVTQTSFKSSVAHEPENIVEKRDLITISKFSFSYHVFNYVSKIYIQMLYPNFVKGEGEQ